MITRTERGYIEENAYLPEHIPQYVTAISKTEPFLLDDYIVHAKKEHIIFVGYPFQEPLNDGQMKNVFEDAMKRFKPRSVALIAPAIPHDIDGCDHPVSDHYYRLDLATLSISQKLRNMLTRASRELSVERARTFGRDHEKMVGAFLKTRPIDEGTQFVFKGIDHYVSSSSTAWIFNVRNQSGELVAFDIGEFSARQYALYMFNFSSDTLYVPGASDLLLSDMIQYSRGEGKRYINLGLGINPGIAFFKKKWGGGIFLPYASCVYKPRRREGIGNLLQKL